MCQHGFDFDIRLKSSELQSFGCPFFTRHGHLASFNMAHLKKFRSETDENHTVNWFVDNWLGSFSGLDSQAFWSHVCFVRVCPR